MITRIVAIAAVSAGVLFGANAIAAKYVGPDRSEGLSVPAMTLMGIGNPHSAVPVGDEKSFDDRLQSKRKILDERWDNLFSRNVYPEMGLGNPHPANG
jgi:hypothetical protein